MAHLSTKIIEYCKDNSVNNVDFEKDVILLDNGSGAFIHEWNVDGLAEPTDEQIASYETVANSIETNDLVRKSAYSFELHNNNLRIFPIPKDTDNGNKLWFEYYVKDDIKNTNNE